MEAGASPRKPVIHILQQQLVKMNNAQILKVSLFRSLFPITICLAAGGEEICECVNNFECEDQEDQCEVSCAADCNDKRCKGQKCFSRLACDKDLLFERNRK